MTPHATVNWIGLEIEAIWKIRSQLYFSIQKLWLSGADILIAEPKY